MTTPQDIRALEEVAVAGLPCERMDVYDGWLVRTSSGYSRRANSVAPLYPSTIDPQEKIRYCEEFYAAVRQPALFKLTSASTPAGLDAALEARGYRREGETLVCTRTLAADLTPPTHVELTHTPAGDWLDTWGRLSRHPAARAIFSSLLAATPTPAAYVLVRRDGVGVGCARATISGGIVGLYDLHVDALHRRRGLATDLTVARLAWARSRGVQRAMLQVLAQNDAAQALQSGLGFVEAYRYWYRVQA